MQYEENLESALKHLVRLMAPADTEGHVDAVADVAQIVPGKLVGQSAGVAKSERGDGGQLGQQAHPLQITIGRIVDVLGVGVEGGKRAYHAQQHAHGVGVVAEALQELGDVGMDVRM